MSSCVLACKCYLVAIIILFAHCLILVDLTRIKISIIPNDKERYVRQATTACDDKELVDRNSLDLTGILSMLNDRVLFYRSSTATQQINSLIRSYMVAGLGITAETVIEILKNGGCPFFIYGGVVRDQFLGVSSNDIDAEVDCDISTVVAICRREWGNEFCGSESDHITHIGTQRDPNAIDIGQASRSFSGSLLNLEYTVNALVYDLNGRNIVLDLPGSGVMDVCNMHIRIPSDDDSETSWDAWASSEGNNKLYRFWKLRFKGFTAINVATKNFITMRVKNAIGSQMPMGLGFKRFYCTKVFGDNFRYSTETNICQSAADTCNSNSEKAVTYTRLLKEDLGGAYVDTLKLPTCGTTSGTTPTNSRGMIPTITVAFVISFLYIFFSI